MTAFTLPTSRPVTQDWAREFYNFKGVAYPQGFYRSLGWLGHNGIDYGCWIGDAVEAVCDGVIEYVGPGNNHPLLTGGGNTILLRNDELGIRFEYLHLSQQNVYTGQRVSMGQVIGLSGDSGAATAPHLHLGAIPVGYVNQNDGWRGRVDPTPYLYGTTQGAIITASAIINHLQEAGVALELKDLEAIQGLVNTSEGRIIADARAQSAWVLNELAQKIEDKAYEVKVFTQAVNNQNADRTIMDNRAQEEATRAAIAGGK
ncbi:M23 family metallopeptidase [Arthrobacter sp. PAMC25564]|uniref:M23 family metallopeptidase n=1 Tax=Arthrobacter sp. PAMC25564 TaxID=2565366 RepID=UPI0010A27CB5|nr:M23 family metallopeptidase [Arthrobacter sp. PAMC25564]QCB97111.1 M23 family metallopeptidase [Arthrobacter sp. PAMC25564]